MIERRSIDNGRGNVDTKECFYTTSSYESGNYLAKTFIFCTEGELMFVIDPEISKDVPSIMEEETSLQKNVFIQRPAMNQVNI